MVVRYDSHKSSTGLTYGAVMFPIVYRELAKENDIPDTLKFIPFVEWDR